MRSWEVQRRKAEKRRREAARRERRKGEAQKNVFRLVRTDAEGNRVETMTSSVIVKKSDESVYDAGFDEIEPGMTLIIEGHMGRIERAVIEEKIEPEEEGGVRTVSLRRA